RYIYAICDTYACCASFFFDARASTELYTLALHDALPILGLVTVRKPTRRERQHFLQTFHHQRERLLIAVRWIHPMPSSKMKVIEDRKSTRLNSSHVKISYAVFCLKKKKNKSTL